MTKRVLTGNDAVAFGALRAGVRVVTGYPGTRRAPSAPLHTIRPSRASIAAGRCDDSKRAEKGGRL